MAITHDDPMLALVAICSPLPPASERRAIRVRAGLTQQALADALGINRRTVVRWESDQEPLPSLKRDAYSRMLRALDAEGGRW